MEDKAGILPCIFGADDAIAALRELVFVALGGVRAFCRGAFARVETKRPRPFFDMKRESP